MAVPRLAKDQAVEGAQLIEQLRINHFGVTAACWLWDYEKDAWRLFIVSKTVDDNGRREGHQALETAFRQLPDLWMDSSEVCLIGPTHRLAQEIAAIQRRYLTGRLKDRHYIKLGGISSGEVHIYPLIPQA